MTNVKIKGTISIVVYNVELRRNKECDLRRRGQNFFGDANQNPNPVNDSSHNFAFLKAS
jgi:hypothetical protein